MDVSAAVVALTGFAPVLAVAAAAIKLEDGGPVLFRQERVGRDGVPFAILKLRTFHEGRVTRVGRALRATGIDEVPQFVNVLRGDMAVVGPRPVTREDLERWGYADESWRTAVRPGITGPAQLWGQNAADALRLDREVAEGRTVRGDLGLIALSFAVNLVGKRRVRRWTGAGRGRAAPAAPDRPPPG